MNLKKNNFYGLLFLSFFCGCAPLTPTDIQSKDHYYKTATISKNVSQIKNTVIDDNQTKMTYNGAYFQKTRVKVNSTQTQGLVWIETTGNETRVLLNLTETPDHRSTTAKIYTCNTFWQKGADDLLTELNWNPFKE